MVEKTQERYKHLVEGVRDHAIFLLDGVGRVAYWSPAAARVLGFSDNEALRRPFSDFFTTEDQQTCHPEQVLKEATRQGGFERTGWCVRCNGERFWAELNLARLDSPDASGFTVVLRDISERRRTELELERAVQHLRALSRELMQVQENERRHLARELHDELGHVLTALSPNLQVIKRSCCPPELERVEESIALLDGAIQQVRNLSLDLRPAMLDDLGLASTLRWYAERHARRAGIEVEFTARTDGAELPAELTNACFRVAQEALTNVVRHSGARHVRMELDQCEQRLRLIVSDDGIGFDLQDARRRASHGESAGLAGMQERVELLGGRLEIETGAGRGTTVRVELPVPALAALEAGGGV